MSRKLKIAVTGGIGTGKSLFCRFLEEDGFQVIHADRLSKELLQTNTTLKEKIIDAFGSDSYEKGDLNRSYLAGIVFSDPENAKKINQIVHPFVIAEQDRLMEQALTTEDCVFVEAALIYEAKAEVHFNRVVLITADKEIRIKRIVKRDGSSPDEIKKRMKLQLPENVKAEKADYVIYNNGTREDLKAGYDNFISEICE